MDERARALLEGRNFATVSMGRKDGSVFSVYTWIDLEGDRITLNTSQGRVWPKIIDRDPRVTILVAGSKDPDASVALLRTNALGRAAREHGDVRIERLRDRDPELGAAPEHEDGRHSPCTFTCSAST